ncbi:MAG: ribose 5-phosphate isomerase B [Treponema sp.]|jgi:ribose 5-phosphate isomerase B|nr:ribose 5-phosphate isomerase B [Treponema sp.]
MKIAIGNDHRAFRLKCEIRDYLAGKGHEMIDAGAHDEAGSDYPVYGRAVAELVAQGRAELGIAICGTGAGISIAANKVRGIRAVVCSEPYTARLARQHNNANVLAFGARVIGIDMAKMIVDEWLAASFEGGRHQSRIDQISALESIRESMPVDL